MARRPSIEGGLAVEFCSCGCGASLRGWSNVGFRRGRRDGVERKYTQAHGTCMACGEMLDQYEVCRFDGSEDHAQREEVQGITDMIGVDVQGFRDSLKGRGEDKI